MLFRSFDRNRLEAREAKLCILRSLLPKGVVVDPVALAPVTLIHGSEEVLAERALDAELGKRQEYERTFLAGAELAPGRFAEAIAPSLFAEKRVVVIRALHDAPTEIIEEIEGDLEIVDPNVHLIFIHGGGNKAKIGRAHV